MKQGALDNWCQALKIKENNLWNTEAISEPCNCSLREFLDYSIGKENPGEIQTVPRVEEQNPRDQEDYCIQR